MLNEVVQTAINKQINHEFYSSYLYLAISAHFEYINLPGFAHWMHIQSKEETFHATKLFNYVNDRGGRVELEAIGKPATDFGSPLEAFEAALEHEQGVTKMIGELYALAVKENDYPSQVELQWFVQEQVEEEKTARTIIDQLKMIGDHGSALMILDRELAARQETVPVQ